MIKITCLDDIASLRESTEIECKLAQGKDGRGALPKDMWESYSAFANTLGGDIFSGLVDKGLIFQEGAGRGTVYFLSSAPVKGLGAGSEGGEVSSGGTDVSSKDWGILKTIATPVAEKLKSPRELVESTILALCQQQMLTLSEMAHLLNRSPIVIRKNYLQALIKDKRLVYRYPESPNHPSQAYWVSGEEVDK